jgi:hypothetical protein
MRCYFISESINHIPQMLINTFLVYRIIFINEDKYPNKVDQVLNREISQLVFLKNKIKQPDLFGVHDQDQFQMEDEIISDFKQRQRLLFDLTIKNERFESSVFKLWGRSETELRTLIFLSYIQRSCFNFTEDEEDELFEQGDVTDIILRQSICTAKSLRKRDSSVMGGESSVSESIIIDTHI